MRFDLFLCTFFALVFAAALAELAGYRWQVGLAPALAAGAGLCLAALVALTSLHDRQAAATVRWNKGDVGALAWFAAALAAVVLLGFAVGGGTFVFAHTLATQPRPARLPMGLVSAAAVVATVLLLFGEVLQIALWRGLLLGG